MTVENRDTRGTVEPFDAAGLRGAASVARQIVSVQAAPGIDLRATIEGLLATIAARDAELKAIHANYAARLKQAQALRGQLVAHLWSADCTRDAETCPVDECSCCSVQDCPWGEPLHYHHDGCPACSVDSGPVST